MDKRTPDTDALVRDKRQKDLGSLPLPLLLYGFVSAAKQGLRFLSLCLSFLYGFICAAKQALQLILTLRFLAFKPLQILRFCLRSEASTPLTLVLRDATE
jgi:hypothetical protein